MPLYREKQVSVVNKDQLFHTVTAKIFICQLKRHNTEKSFLTFYSVQQKEQVMLENGGRAEQVGVCTLSVVAPSVALGLPWIWRSD